MTRKQRYPGTIQKLCGIAIAAVIATALSSCGGGTSASVGPVQEDEAEVQRLLGELTAASNDFEPYFSEKLKAWTEQGAKPASRTITVPGTDVAGHSEQSLHRAGRYAGKDNVLIWDNSSTNWIEYEVEIGEAGLYQIDLSYHAYDSSNGNAKNYRPAVFAVTVDGEFPFMEARSIGFPRLFRDAMPIRKDEYGDDIRPRPEEIDAWIDRPFRDNSGSYAAPLQWYLDEGKHTIRLQTHGSIVIDKLVLGPPQSAPDYEPVSGTDERSAGKTAGEAIVVEAEMMHEKNDVSLQMDVDQDAMTTPKAGGRQIFNAVGGNRWETGGEAITWKFSVPEDGYYKIGARVFQGYQLNKRVFRTIYIDGQVPFQPFYEYPFEYASSWQGTVLRDGNREPYRMYLTKGEHTITMEVTIAPFADVLNDLNDAILIFSGVSQDLYKLVGTEEDQNRTWDVENNFPEIPKKLKVVLSLLKRMEQNLLGINGGDDNNSQTISGAIRDIEDILEYANDIPYKRKSISTVQQRLASIQQPLMQAPLMIDKLYIVPADGDFPKMEAGFAESVANNVKQFFFSFDERARLSGDDEEVVNVWMNYGRDYVNVLQDLADQYFTPETGIKVRVDLLPNEDLIVMANAAGKAPDVAIGLTEGRPIELAIRGAALELNQFEDFARLSEQYAPGAIVPYYFDGNYYALPESQKFNILFYRKDIMDRLGLKVPQTWDEVMDILPTLQQNGYDFNIPQDYLTFFFQNGAEFYTKDGLATGLDSPEGFQAFKQYTDFYSVYGIERQITSFYQHFRDGDMPIGIGDFNMYLQLAVAAPEINGWWGIAPLPGLQREDGTIQRWSGGGQQASMIFEKSKNKEEAWQFMKWWLSAETQERFGSDLEGFYGITFRWNTANVEAFSHLPWTPEELNVYLEQWRWYKDMANVPGSYFIPREINNAWNRTVLDGQNYRAALEEAVLNINREIRRKAIEFEYIDKAGNVLKTYDPPVIDKPWEGASKYVR
ncbi:extracellular solute-binding protein [Paenibacillus thailandensis]|uniref:Extracellular solute-binding protein n=1 Tax=Paenibacillus thailandensis TaxID=393250 RepID=A0ABW5R2A3_9BACL